MELVEIIGVVDAFGVHGAGGESGQSLYFNLNPWRKSGGANETGKISVIKDVSSEEYDRYQKLISSYDVVKIKGVIKAAYNGNGVYLELHEYIGLAEDSEFRLKSKELQKPIVITDSLLGKLVFNRRLGLFEGTIPWRKKGLLSFMEAKVRIFLKVGDDQNLKSGLNTTHTLFSERERWDALVQDFAVQKLLPLKNDAWLGEGETKVTPEQFKKCMTLESISINLDGSFEFWHDDGDLFCGHSIQISGTLSDGPTHANIPG